MVIGLWALVLLPMWLKSHDQVDEGRQVDRFRKAMTQLSTSQVELVKQTTHMQVQAKRAPAAGLAASTRPTAAARRRRVLAVLSVTQIVGSIAAVAGLGVFAAAIPAGMIVSFLVLARTQVRAEQARRHPAPVSTPAEHKASTFARSLAAAKAAVRASRRMPATASVDVVEQAPAAPTVAPDVWAPVRTPLPGYVSAPAATAVPRAIDAAGGWTGSAMVEAARAIADAELVVDALQSMVNAVDPDITTEIPVIRHSA